MSIQYEAVARIRSPHTECTGMPIQPCGARGVRGQIVFDENMVAGLADLDGFSHIICIYHLHKMTRIERTDPAFADSLLAQVFLDETRRGVFATRSPRRPNPIGLSVLEVLGVEGAVVHVNNVDILDGTPVLDVKPFVSDFDWWEPTRFGWFEGRSTNAATLRADDRFTHTDQD